MPQPAQDRCICCAKLGVTVSSHAVRIHRRGPDGWCSAACRSSRCMRPGNRSIARRRLLAVPRAGPRAGTTRRRRPRRRRARATSASGWGRAARGARSRRCCTPGSRPPRRTWRPRRTARTSACAPCTWRAAREALRGGRATGEPARAQRRRLECRRGTRNARSSRLPSSSTPWTSDSSQVADVRELVVGLGERREAEEQLRAHHVSTRVRRARAGEGGCGLRSPRPSRSAAACPARCRPASRRCRRSPSRCSPPTARPRPPARARTAACAWRGGSRCPRRSCAGRHAAAP